MRFGDYIRDIRRDLKWTQPQAAKEIGIEQSYLSKLESGKSYPSEDVFSSLLKVYKLDLVNLKSKLFAADLDRLREIGEVRSLILSNEKDTRKRVQNWILAGVFSLALGGACLGATFLAEDKEVNYFQYKSEGVTLEGESVNAFEIIGDDVANNQDAQKNQQEMMNRADEQYQSLEDYRGVVFFETVPEGTRTWRFFGGKKETIQSPLRWFMIPAISLILGGLGCFFASYRAS